jgi:hypothetical protein
MERVGWRAVTQKRNGLHMKAATSNKRGPTADRANPPASAKMRRPVGVERNVHGHRSDDGEAFIHDPQGGPAHTRDDLAEDLAESFLGGATSGQDEIHDELLTEELGGPFIEGRASMEFADDIDEMNPEDAPREPFPTAMRSTGGK